MKRDQEEESMALLNWNTCNSLSPQGLGLVPLGEARDQDLIANTGYEASKLQLPLGSWKCEFLGVQQLPRIHHRNYKAVKGILRCRPGNCEPVGISVGNG